jgi:hypothetical protein
LVSQEIARRTDSEGEPRRCWTSAIALTQAY